MNDYSRNSNDLKHQITPDDGRNYISVFWWLFKFLVGASLLSATLAWALTSLPFYEWPVYRNFDIALSEYFPGIASLSRAATSPAVWRLYFYSMALATVFGCITVGKRSWHLSTAESKLILPRGAIVFLLPAIILFVSIWFVFFNRKTVALDIVSRGAALLAVFHTSYIGLALFGWVFFFFIVICVAVLAKLAGSYFRS